MITFQLRDYTGSIWLSDNDGQISEVIEQCQDVIRACSRQGEISIVLEKSVIVLVKYESAIQGAEKSYILGLIQTLY